MIRPARISAVLLLLAAAPVFSQEPLAWRVATGLARLGPRPDGAPAQGPAARFLLDSMRRAGLKDVRTAPVAGHPDWVNLTGVLQGRSEREIVLSAHYDSVPAGPGAGDDASGCGVAIAAAADLARTPLEHTVRVVLFDAEEAGLKGSKGWVASLATAQRDRILADLNVEMVGWAGSAGPTLHSFPMDVKGEWTLAPAWLVHFLLRSGDAVDWHYGMSDAQAPFLAQLVLRSARIRLGADANAFTAQGIPAISVSDSSLLRMDPAYHRPTDTPARLDPARMEGWTTAVTAAVRRMDRLAGRPVQDDEFLVLFNRVWSRRDLYWLGIGLWLLLAFRGRPRGARFATAEERSMAWHRHLPGVLFRALFLAAVLLSPVLSVLLFPLGLLAAFPPKKTWARISALVVGLLPLLLFAGALGVAFKIGMASTRAGLQWGTLAPVLATAVMFAILAMRRTPAVS
ncbi:MAG TPA: M28 family peptidase [Thermoanaerobaculia bacterium]|nr:M28 family peptidase [Thermoanaerobaculia bacterium]